MPPKKNTDNGDASGAPISGVNWKLIDAVFKFCPPGAKPNIDWNALAETTGHKNGKSARDSFRTACEKFGWFKADGDNLAGATPGTASAKKNNSVKATKKKASPKNVSDDTSDNEAEGEIETPTKKRKSNPKNGLETPMKKTKLIDEAKDKAKDEVQDEAKDEIMAEDKGEYIDEV
ncbi:hypothetical protein PG993_014388 [Apiospora rasikravindrae]|uniref:Uncharacterized protein n=1 Tax=Apiospora rasikravindrae TaxID=990691 RepID=A0ABR1RMJ2_9PEZI